MEAQMEGMLEDTFRAFTGGAPEMAGRSFVKCIRDAGLLDAQMQVVDVDLIFAKCKPKGGRKIDFVEFQDCLAMVADKKRLSDQDVIDAVCGAAAPNYETKSSLCSATFETSGIGPERFYYDRSTYTGTHRNGGPKTYGDIVTDSSLVVRGRELDDALHRRKVGDRELPMLLGGAGPGSGTMSATSSRDAKEVGSARPRRPRSPLKPQAQAASGRRPAPAPPAETQEVSFQQQMEEQQQLEQQLQHRMAQQHQQPPAPQQVLQLPPPPPTAHHQGGYPTTAMQPQRYAYVNQLPVASHVAVASPVQQVVVQQQGYPQGLVSTFAGTGYTAMPAAAPAAWAQPRYVAPVMP